MSIMKHKKKFASDRHVRRFVHLCHCLRKVYHIACFLLIEHEKLSLRTFYKSFYYLMYLTLSKCHCHFGLLVFFAICVIRIAITKDPKLFTWNWKWNKNLCNRQNMSIPCMQLINDLRSFNHEFNAFSDLNLLN